MLTTHVGNTSEMVETVLQHSSRGQQMRDGMEMHSSFHTPVKDLTDHGDGAAAAELVL